MEELIEILNNASKAYYHDAREIMSDLEFDKLYDELLELEKSTGILLGNSPTVKVGYEVLSELPKESHESAMLSLDKSKEVSRLEEFLGNQLGVLSWKLDGLTIVLTYEDGLLIKAITRGNGEVGEVVTNNARTFKNIPHKIQYKGKLVVRGEAVIGYSDFEEINRQIDNVDEKYKNPRNLCSGSVRQLNNEITAKRNVRFFAFGLVEAGGVEFHNSRKEQLNWLETQGFQTVENEIVSSDSVRIETKKFSEKINSNEYPSDGLVITYDNISYGEGLGTTAKFPRNAFAFKWQDELKETTLREIEWSASRTGLINPVAIFDSVELEGTTVSRASVHNISVLEELELGIGDTIKVYKANMIIPQVAENLTKSNNVIVPQKCPVCSEDTCIKQEASAKVLICENNKCMAKQLKSFALFVSRNALNIEGLSEATLEKFVEYGILSKFTDLFSLEQYQERIEGLEGFGEKSFKKLIKSAEKAKTTTLAKLIYGLGIANVGVSNAKMICKAFDNDSESICGASLEELSQIDGVGQVIAESFVEYFVDPENRMQFKELLSILNIPTDSLDKEQILQDKVFVVTGSVEIYKNRNEIKERIEELGGKVTGSVSAKTHYLINNDINSTSSKNKKARDLNIPIISEQEFNDLINAL